MRQHRYLPHVREPSRLNPAAASASAGTKTRDPHVSHSNSPGKQQHHLPTILGQGVQQGGVYETGAFSTVTLHKALQKPSTTSTPHIPPWVTHAKCQGSG